MEHTYAQTIICLYNQLREEGYSNDDILFIRKTYDLAKLLFSGRFQISGKEFLSHCIGTASILTSLRLPTQLIAAALIHNAYVQGDFGNRKKFITKARRKYIRKVLNNEVEESVALFAKTRWDRQNILKVRERINDLSHFERNVVLLHTADNIEHLLDLDFLHYTDIEKERYISNIDLLEEITLTLGLPELSKKFKELINESVSYKFPMGLIKHNKASYVIVPRSYKKRILVLLIERLHKLNAKIKTTRIFDFLKSQIRAKEIN